MMKSRKEKKQPTANGRPFVSTGFKFTVFLTVIPGTLHLATCALCLRTLQCVYISGIPWLPAGGRCRRYTTMDQSSSSLRVPFEPGIPDGRIP